MASISNVNLSAEKKGARAEWKEFNFLLTLTDIYSLVSFRVIILTRDGNETNAYAP